MERKYWIVILVLITIGMLCTSSISAKTPNKQAGKSNIGHLYLYEKDPVTWEIVDDGSWGKMRYELSGELFDFVFNAHNLTVGIEYTLIYYPDPWPGEGLICLGTGLVNDEGNLHIKEKIETGDLPKEFDDNYLAGAKIWCVLTSDVDCIEQKMTGWSPAEYLFEYDLILFDDTDEFEPELEPEEEVFESLEDEPLISLESSVKEEKIKFENNFEHVTETLSEVLNRKLTMDFEKLPPGLVKLLSPFNMVR